MAMSSGGPIIKIGGIVTPPYDVSSIPTKPDPAWWDLPGQAEAAVEAVKFKLTTYWFDFWSWTIDGLFTFLDVALPTLAGIGILWWMFPFLPNSDKGAKLTGASLIIYMFYVLLRSV